MASNMSEAAAPFDPFSSSSKAGSAIILVGIASLIYSSYTMGKNANDKSSGGFRFGMYSIVVGIAVFLGAMYIWWAYD
jgi:hypothetical protein